MAHARLKARASRGPGVPVSHPDLLCRSTPAFESVFRAVSGPGRPLEHGLQAEFGRRFGRDFSGVRVHIDQSAAESATALGATAYTLGQSIVFGPGRYSPGTITGRRLIAHELAHVAQRDTPDGGDGGSVRIDPSPPAEADAREAAGAADVPGGTATSTLRPVGRGAIQRQATDEENKPKTEAKPPSPPMTAVPPATTASPASTSTQATPPRRVIDASVLSHWPNGPAQAEPSPNSADPKNALPLLPPLTFPPLPQRTPPGFPGLPQLTLPSFPGLPQQTSLTPEPEPVPEPTPPPFPAPGLTPTIPTTPQLDPNLWRDLKQPEKKGPMDWLTTRPTPPLYSNPDLLPPMEPGSPKGQFIFPLPPLKLDPQFRPDFKQYQDLLRRLGWR